MIINHLGFEPVIDKSTFVAKTAAICGYVNGESIMPEIMDMMTDVLKSHCEDEVITDDE